MLCLDNGIPGDQAGLCARVLVPRNGQVVLKYDASPVRPQHFNETLAVWLDDSIDTRKVAVSWLCWTTSVMSNVPTFKE